MIGFDQRCMIHFLFPPYQQETSENGGISDQQFYCGPVGEAFEYNEMVVPYVGVAIMFISVVYSRFETFVIFNTFLTSFNDFPLFSSVYSHGRFLSIHLRSLGTSSDSAVALGITAGRRDYDDTKKSSCFPSCFGSARGIQPSLSF